MHKSVADLKSKVVTENPTLALYIDDIPSHTDAQAFHNASFSSERRGLLLQVEFPSRLTEQKAYVLHAIEKALSRGAVIRDECATEVDLWFESHRHVCAAYIQAIFQQWQPVAAL